MKQFTDEELITECNRRGIPVYKFLQRLNTPFEDYCRRCNQKRYLRRTFQYWISTGSYDYLCDDCIEYYWQEEKRKHPEFNKRMTKFGPL